MKIDKSIIDKFWSNVDQQGPNDCWPWQGYLDRDGYGRYGRYGSDYINFFGTALTHRQSAILTGMNIKNMLVCHHCDNPRCVNPGHLFVGTPADNTRDMVRKGRVAKGEQSGQARLTTRDVLNIRNTYIPYIVTQQQLADQYGVHRLTVHNIINRHGWNHI